MSGKGPEYNIGQHVQVSLAVSPNALDRRRRVHSNFPDYRLVKVAGIVSELPREPKGPVQKVKAFFAGPEMCVMVDGITLKVTTKQVYPNPTT